MNKYFVLVEIGPPMTGFPAECMVYGAFTTKAEGEKLEKDIRKLTGFEYHVCEVNPPDDAYLIVGN